MLKRICARFSGVGKEFGWATHSKRQFLVNAGNAKNMNAYLDPFTSFLF